MTLGDLDFIFFALSMAFYELLASFYALSEAFYRIHLTGFCLHGLLSAQV